MRKPRSTLHRGQARVTDTTSHHIDNGLVDRAIEMNFEGAGLLNRFRQTGRSDILNNAIERFRTSMRLFGPSDERRSMPMINLAMALGIRCGQTDNDSDVIDAIKLGRESLRLRPLGHPGRTATLNILSNALVQQSARTGDIEQLNEAVSMCRESLMLCEIWDPNRRSILRNLATTLGARFSYTGDIVDLEESVKRCREAVRLPEKGPDPFSAPVTLALALAIRFDISGHTSDLDEAISLCTKARVECGTTYPNRARILNHEVVVRLTRLHLTGGTADLGEVVNLARESLRICGRNHEERGRLLTTLAEVLKYRFEETHNSNDLKEAIKLAGEAVQRLGPHHPQRSLAVVLLAGLTIQQLDTRFVNGWGNSIEHLRKATLPSPSRVGDRLLAAQTWRMVSRKMNHPSELEAMIETLNLVDESVSRARSLDSLYRQVSENKHIQQVQVVASDAAALAFNRGDVELGATLLERGRTIIFTQLGRFRQALDDLKKVNPELAGRFSRLSDDLNDLVTQKERARAMENFAEARIKDLGAVYQAKHTQWASTAAQIRQLSGFESFMGPPSFEHLQQAAAYGPIILLNINIARSDAVIIRKSGAPIIVPLPRCTPDAVLNLAGRLDLVVREELGKTEQIDKTHFIQPGSWRILDTYLPKFAHVLVERLWPAEQPDDKRDNIPSILRVLWHLIVLPIVLRLQALPKEDLGTRIWWCATGATSRLPLHMAGPYRPNEKNLANLFISSYTPTVGTLIRARRPNPQRIQHAVGPYRMSENILPGQFISSYNPMLGPLISSSHSASSEPRLPPPICSPCHSRIACVPGFFILPYPPKPTMGSMLVVGQPHTPGQAPILGVPRELNNIKMQAPHATVLLSSNGTKENILKQLPASNWLHLACHGHHHLEKPFLSHFSMHDGPLALQDLIEKPLPSAELAFLSACHSARASEVLPDEALHLAAGMMFAGYRSVIGTMWSFDDDLGSALAGEFYKSMLGGPNGPRSYSASANALKNAFGALDKTRAIPLVQRINVVHYGA